MTHQKLFIFVDVEEDIEYDDSHENEHDLKIIDAKYLHMH